MNARLLKAATGTRVRGHRGWKLAEHHTLICVYIVDTAVWLLTNSGLYGHKTGMDEIDRDLARIIVRGFLLPAALAEIEDECLDARANAMTIGAGPEEMAYELGLAFALAELKGDDDA